MKKKVKKYHKGGSHEDHHVSRVEREPAIAQQPAPQRPAQKAVPAAQISRLPSSKRTPPRPTRTTGQLVSAPRPTQPIMQPTQTGQVSAMQRIMMEQAREQARRQQKTQDELRKANEKFQQRVAKGGDRRIRKGSEFDNAIRNARRQQLESYAKARDNSLLNRYRRNRGLVNAQDQERDRVEGIRLRNEQERIQGTGRRINPNAGRRRVRRRR